MIAYKSIPKNDSWEVAYKDSEAKTSFGDIKKYAYISMIANISTPTKL